MKNLKNAQDMKKIADDVLYENSPEGKFEKTIEEKILEEASKGKKFLEIDWPKDITNVPYGDTAPIVAIPKTLRDKGYDVYLPQSYIIDKFLIKWLK
jgi:hypothetical protein